MKRRHKHLTGEDRVLWNRVARSTVPMPGKTLPPAEKTEQPPPREPKSAVPGQGPAAAPPPPRPPEPHPRRLDTPTREKLARGRIDIGGRVDLHGLTQEEAHMLLLSFLRRAHDSDRRYVLVITGKGSSGGGTGVLRRAVPQWLSTPPFRTIVGGYEEAARHHGGGGALYIRLRRRRAP